MKERKEAAMTGYESDLQVYLGIETTVVPRPSDEEILSVYMQDMFTKDDKGKSRLNENTFGEAFSDVNDLQYSNGLFYTRQGKASEDMISRDIWESLRGFGITTDVDRWTKKLLGAVKLASTVEKLEVRQNVIPFANGDLHVDRWNFREDECKPSPYRLSVNLVDTIPDTPHFNKWLHDLFYDEDIPVIQEYLGYCLVPTTRAQKALFLVGEGGAGKSVIGAILQSILGDAMMATQSTKDFLSDKFKLPELEHKLVLYDDDLDNTALSETGFYKKLITNKIAITADRKYTQAFQFTPYVKIVSCCNQMLTSMYDNTNGFFRRLLPVQVKPVAPDFVPDRDFYDKVAREKEGIVLWSLIGLKRLIRNHWELSESSRTKDYLRSKQNQGNHFPEFLDTVFIFEPGAQITTKEIVSIYKVWCQRNAYDPRKDKTLQVWLSDNEIKYGIKKSNNIPANGRKIRGYIGMRARKEWEYHGQILLS